jgi:hypothetical protein
LKESDGTRNASCFVVLQGYVVALGTQSKINSPRAGIFSVKWKNNRLPDGVKIGTYVTIVGQIVTLDLGRAFYIIKAEALTPRSMVRIKRAIEGEKHA